jgi:alkylated DNA repair dioxygenase AlkB
MISENSDTKSASAVRRTDLLRNSSTKQQEERSTSSVTLWENVFSDRETTSFLEELSGALPFHVEMDDFGKQSRPTCYYGDSPDCVFAYVGLTLRPRPWTPTLRRLRDQVTRACQLDEEESSSPSSSSRLTACLVNHYPANQGYIPWHYDEVRAHGDTKTVASLSLGGPRRFQLRKRGGGGELVADLLLPSGSVLLMQGAAQDEYEHCLPLDEQAAPPRISLTFRSIVPGWEGDIEATTDVCCTQAPDYTTTRPTSSSNV